MIGRIVSLDSTMYTQWVLYFFVYSLLGWLVSTAYASLKAKHGYNVGFLRGPWMPSYGMGALLGLLLAQWLSLQAPWRIPILFALLCAVYTLFDRGFQQIMSAMLPSSRKQPHPFKTSLLHGLLFSAAALFMLYVLQPLLQHSLSFLPAQAVRYLSWLAQLILIVDFILSIGAIQRLQQKRKNLQSEKDSGLPVDLVGWLSTFSGYERRIFVLFPLSREYKLIAMLPEAKKRRKQKRRASFWQHIAHFSQWLLETPSEDHIAKEGKPVSFAHGLNFYKIFGVFFICSIIGFVLETIFCVITRGHLESRQGLLYGPFSQIYGFGALLMLIPTYPMRKKNNLFIFVVSALVGGLFEALASLIQEYVFGSVSWTYDALSIPLLGGRTSLLFMLMWGALGIFLIRTVYPKLSRWIERIPNAQGIVLSWILFLLLLIDAALSGLAVSRWNQRLNHTARSSAVGRFLDQTYPDEYMTEIYPNMIHNTSS